MKKISIFIIFLTGCIWLSACGNGIVSVGNTEISEETMKNAYYDLAKKQCDNKKYVSAINTIDLECNGYDPEGIREKAKDEIERIRSYASAVYLLSERDIVFINENNTLDVVGDSTYISTLGWNDLKQIERMNYRIVGLKNDGTVDVSDYYYKSSLFANDEPTFIDKVKSWTNIVNIAVLTGVDNSYIFGLKIDGTIVVACKDESNNKYESVELWTNVEKIVGNSTTYGLYGITKDGELLYSSNYTFENTNNIIDLDSDSFSLLVTSNSINSRGLPLALPADLNYQNIVDVEVGNHYAAFLYDNGNVKFWNIDTDQINDVSELDNVAALSGTSEFIVAYKCNNEIAIIGNTENTDIVSESGIQVIDMKLNEQRNSNSTATTKDEKEYEPVIGMTKEEVILSSWGKPKKKNITETYWGTHEQWVYSSERYVYFENGIVTAIQKTE